MQSISGTSKLAIALNGQAECTRIPRLCTRPLARTCNRKPRVVGLWSPCGATLCEVSGAALERPTSQIAMLCISSVLCCLRFLCCLRLSLPRAQRVTGILAHASTDKPTLNGWVVQCLAQGTPQGMGAPGYPDCDPCKKWVLQDTPIVIETQGVAAPGYPDCANQLLRYSTQVVAQGDDMAQVGGQVLCNAFAQCNPA